MLRQQQHGVLKVTEHNINDENLHHIEHEIACISICRRAAVEKLFIAASQSTNLVCDFIFSMKSELC